MELKRKIYEKILSWKNTSRGQTALLIEGARRIGNPLLQKNLPKRIINLMLLLILLLSLRR